MSGQIGFKTESVFGIGVTVDQFVPFLSESITLEQAALPYKGIVSGRRTMRGNKRGVKMVGGSLSLELYNKPMATLLRHMFGTIATTGVGPYVHTASPGDLTGKSMTIQMGRPQSDGTVFPFSYYGCKLPGWTLACTADQIATLDLDVVAQDEDSDGTPALATATFLTGIAPFVFFEGVVQVGGLTVATVSSASLKATNGLKTDRKRLGFYTVNQMLENALRTYEVDLTVDFEAMTHYGRYTANTEAAVVLTFTSSPDILQITMNARTDGGTPTVQGEDMLTQSLKYVIQHTSADSSAITAALTNAEAVSI